MADEAPSTTDAEAPGVITIPDASSTQEELNAKIDSELGLPHQETETPEPAKEETPDENNPSPPAPADSDNDETPEESDTDTPEEEPEVTPAETDPQTPPAQPSDAELFIEVMDAEGVTHKISTIDDLPEDFQARNNRDALKILGDLAKLDTQREQREAEAATAAEAAALAETQQAQFKSWDSEITELAKTDRLDATNTDRLNDIFGYMNEINAARHKAGNPNLITSFEDALDKFEAKESREAAELATKNGNDMAKAKSSLIGRSSASTGGSSYVYRAGSARSIDDIPVAV